MIYDVSHRTTYRYAAPVAQSQHVLHLSPRAVDRQIVHRHNLMLEPAPTSRIDLADDFGNPVSILMIEADHRESIVHARSTIEIVPRAEIDVGQSAAWEAVRADVAAPGSGIDPEIAQYACYSRHSVPTAAIRDYALGSFADGQALLAGVWDLTKRIYRDFAFDPTATDVSTPLARVWEQRRGVCQDFAHMQLACLRALGLPARYVSGYILTKPPPGQPRLQGTDASHAWISAWSPSTGWVDFDPTNQVMPNGEHIAIAFGRDFDDISPISGVLLGGGDHSVTVAVDVTEVG